MEQKATLDLGGQTLTISTGKMAKLAGGSAVVQLGGTVVLVAASASKTASPNRDFVPLTVDYRERTYAAGKIPGGFFKREGRPTEKEVLSSRLSDRPIRPLFEKNFPYETQIMATVVSSDQEHDSDVLALCGASCAMNLSDIPFPEPVAGVRVGRVDGQFVIMPTFEQLDSSDMDVVVAGTAENIIMVEDGTREVSEADMIGALEFAMDYIRQIVAAQRELMSRSGKPKRPLVTGVDTHELERELDQGYRERLRQAIRIPGKEARQEEVDRVGSEAMAALQERFTDLANHIPKILHEIERDELRRMVLREKVRADGRGPDDIRKVTVEVGVLPRTHGSCLFTRGETQALAVATLGTKSDEQRIEELEGQSWKSYMLHYNFPPFSVGEVRPIRGPGRREIGHGALAERSIEPVIPAETHFPYTLRVVSDILESNGSSSMATVCAGSMALMDAGVPVQRHVSGVAMGLITKNSDNKYAILTDILGDEDHLGDMDFKVTGTREGICGVQMDIKVDGLSMDVMREALAQARKGRLHILDAMYNCIEAPRPDVKPHAPRMEKLFIDKEFIGAVIGPQGKVIQEIQKETGTTINIEEVGNFGEVSIFSPAKDGLEKAVAWIKGIVAVPTVGEVYEAKVKTIQPYGAFVEFLPKKEGLLHISEISWKRLESMEGVLKEGDTVKVKLIGIDHKTGKFKLSRKALMPKPEGRPQPQPQPRNTDGQ